MKKTFKLVVLIAVLSVMLIPVGIGTSFAADKEATIGYQLVYNPWKTSIVDGTFEKVTGYKINWKKFHYSLQIVHGARFG